jgi:WD40-like Beta Propeller Repeat
VSKNWNRSRHKLVLLAVALVAASCGGHARPRVAGHYLVYGVQTETGSDAITLAHADGSGAHTIAHGGDEVLSPDGRWVAFDVERGVHSELYVVSTRGGKPRPLTRTDSWPVWSPSSDRIVTFKGNALASIDLQGHVTVLDGLANGDWSFSPDGRWIVYDETPGPSDESDVYAVHASGGDRHLVIRNAGSPVWGQHWIAFVRDSGTWRARPDGTDVRPVLRGPRQPNPFNIVGYYPVAWAPDDKALLAQIATPHAWDVAIRIDVATGRFTHVHGYPVGLSRDGRFALAFGGRPTGGPENGRPPPPEWIAALPFGHGGRARVLARGDVCCPSWNR